MEQDQSKTESAAAVRSIGIVVPLASKSKKTLKPKCRCHINASYKTKTMWRTGKLPTPCPVPGHDEDLKQ